jgi:hypothetical protein
MGGGCSGEGRRLRKLGESKPLSERDFAIMKAALCSGPRKVDESRAENEIVGRQAGKLTESSCWGLVLKDSQIESPGWESGNQAGEGECETECELDERAFP